uniref:Uncharacterized protein n=1 Tax=Heterorhabditis bacteriophora TaxID=37862 RepID=A0A1I7WUB9_HETBA
MIILKFFNILIIREKCRLSELLFRFLPCCGSRQGKLSRYGLSSDRYTTRTLLNIPKGSDYMTDTFIMNERSMSADDAFL